MIKKTLCELFESNKIELQQTLTGMTLPKDFSRAQEAVSSYMEKVFDIEGEFRQNLTQSEDYILEAAISLLNAQRKISSALTMELGDSPASKKLSSSATSQSAAEATQALNANGKYTLIGVAGGAIAGKFILGGWGAVFGAIAGVAMSIYLSNKSQAQTKTKSALEGAHEAKSNKPLDVDCFIDIIHDVCESVDRLISTFRAQISRVVDKYESQENPTLDTNYRPLLECIQSLVGYKRNRDASEEKYTKKMQERIEDLAESLDNYNITLEDYSEEKSSWFEKVSSPNTTMLKEVFPAVVKNGVLIIPGKVFIPA